MTIDPRTLDPTPADLATVKAFTNTLVPLARLVEALVESGRPNVVEDVTFTNCVIRGPAVIVPGGATHFSNCNMGQTGGDLRNLFLRAVGPGISGAIPVNGCQFEGCQFIGIGFAGEQAFVDRFMKELSGGAQ